MRILVLWRQCAVDSKMRKTDIFILTYITGDLPRIIAG